MVTRKYDVRIQGISEGLTAQERALLVLRSWKEGKEEDRSWRATMPDDQVPAFNRLIHVMNGVNRNLGLYLLAVKLETDKLDLRMGWLATLAFWGMQNFQVAEYLGFETKEPVTESEHRQKVEQARAELAPVAELAEALVYRHEGWADEDIEERDEHDEVIVSDKAWARECRQKERELAELVEQGVLQGAGKGRRLKVNAGSFYDWLGEETPVWPDWGLAFEVLPDDQAEEAERRWRSRRHARQALATGPSLPLLYSEGWPDVLKHVSEWSAKGELDDLVELHKRILREGLEEQWRKLRAVELLVAEAQEAFDGEDPCLPEVRHTLDHTKERLADLHESLRAYVEPFELLEPDEDEVEEVRALYDRQ